MFRRILNYLLYLVFCVMLGTGLLLTFKLVPGREGGRGLEAWGMTRHEWGDIHYLVSLVFLALVALHLWTERKWLAKVAAKGGLWKLIGGLSVGAIAVIAIVSIPVRGGRAENSNGEANGSHGAGCQTRDRQQTRKRGDHDNGKSVDAVDEPDIEESGQVVDAVPHPKQRRRRGE